MRVTRAAQRAQRDVEEHSEAPEVNERALKDIEPNTSPVAQLEEPLPAKTPAKTPAKKSKGKAGRKGAKSKKAKTEEDEVAQVVEDARLQAATSLTKENVEQVPTQGYTDDIAEASSNDEPPKAPQTPGIRLTRRQLAKLEEEEAFGRSQRAPSAPKEDTNDEDANQAANQAADQADTVVEEHIDDAAKVELLITQAERTPVEPESAPKPSRKPRHQKTKLDEGQSSQQVIEDARENDTEDSEAPEGIEHKILYEQHDRAPANEASAQVEPEMAPNSKRLTRHQQAKLEAKQQLSQVDQQTPQREPPDEAAAEVATEVMVEAAIGQNEFSEGITKYEASKIEKATSLEPAAEEHSDRENELAAKPQKLAEQEAKLELAEKSELVDYRVSDTAQMNEVLSNAVEARPTTPTDAEFEADLATHIDSQDDDAITASVEIVAEAEPKMLCDEKPFETSISTPTKSQGSVRRTSRSPSKSPMRIEESISAIDRLEEDLESIGKAIPDVEYSEEERDPRKSAKSSASTAMRGKTPSKTSAKTPAQTFARISAKTASKTPSKTSANAPGTTKAPFAAKATLPTRISKVPNAAPKSVKPNTISLARASSVRTATSKDVRKPSTETADYLASKRRPISLSFPTPPPPPKGRAPTKPTFQLSSESVSAKLRAQKDERLKREAEMASAPKKRPISMPPPAKSTKPPTVPSFQLPGEATAARLKAQKEERMKRIGAAEKAEKPDARPISMLPPSKSAKPITKPSFQLPGEATAARLKVQKEERLKRMEEAEAAKKAALAATVRKPVAHRPRPSLLVRDAPGASIPPTQQAGAPQRSTSLASKRSSIVGPSASRSTSTSSATRNSILLAEGGKSTVTAVDAAALKTKGKQVFNRDKIEKEAMERERKEKEEAAKKARAEAAERGRIASREWAERQRKKMMMGQ